MTIDHVCNACATCPSPCQSHLPKKRGKISPKLTQQLKKNDRQAGQAQAALQAATALLTYSNDSNKHITPTAPVLLEK